MLVRHGESLYNRRGKQAGPDSGLTELGWRQAQAAATWLAHTYRADAVLSSRLMRARQTAEIIAERMGAPFIVHEGIEEAETAYWEELPHAADDALAAWRDQWQPDPDRAPRYTDFRAQLEASLRRLLAQYAGQTLIVVTHGGAIGTILRSLFGGHHIAVFTENTGVTHLAWERGQWQLHYHNKTAHLAEVMPAPPHADQPDPAAHATPWADTQQFEIVAEQFHRVAAASADPSATPDKRQLQRLLQLAQPGPNDRVLDPAVGMGAAALAFAPHVHSVLGVDLSPGMLERAEAARAEQQAQNIHFRLGEIGALPLAAQSFEIIICHDLLHYVTGASALLDRFRFLLAPNGRLVMDEPVGSEDPVKRATQNAIELRRDPAITEMFSATEIERKLKGAGFKVIQSERYKVNRELKEWLDQAAADDVTRSAVREMIEAGLDADSAGMGARRNREDQITFSQSRLRLLAQTEAPARR